MQVSQSWKPLVLAAVAIAGYGMGSVLGLVLMGIGGIGCFMTALQLVFGGRVDGGSAEIPREYLERRMAQDVGLGAAGAAGFDDGSGDAGFGGVDAGGAGDA